MEHKKAHKKQLRISHQTRKELIRLVTCENMSVKFAHSQLGINYSTAKMIVRKYRQSGKITEFRRERNTKLSENSSMEHISCNEQNISDNIGQSGKINQCQGQQITNIQFPTYFFQTPGMTPTMDFYSISPQFMNMAPMAWWDPTQFYLPY